MAVLSPDQFSDLRRSNLTDDTIALMQCEGVRPQELPIKSAVSAYRLPYFNTDGTINCFSRLKFVPEVIDANGKKIKYWQEKGSSPHLYLLPRVKWRMVAKDAVVPLIFTEGEKKAAAGCQQGLVVAGIGGVWCWTSTLDNGDMLTLPMLDEFQWTNRSVLMCPDSDAWHEEKGLNILAGFFALAKDLQQRGASVQFVMLPDIHGAKAGLDDWLLVPGHDVVHSWPKLERIALDDSRFSNLTAWWQKWKEKQATHAAIKQHDAEALVMTETAGLYTVRSQTHAVTLLFDRLSDQRGGVSAELTVTLGATELLSGVDLGLKSETGQTKLARNLSGTTPAIPWKVLLQKACSLVLKHHRRGAPSQQLNKDTLVPPLHYSVNPFVHQRKPTILFADGGTGKSTLGLLCGMCVSVGASVAGISALKGKALYLDYEDDADVHVRRLHAIQAGHPELLAAQVDYLRCTESIPRMLYALVRKIQEDAITFLLVDSLVAAAGGEASLEAVGKLFAALRVLNVDTLCIGHVPKPQQGDGPEHPTVYGSVFNQNYARMLWEVRREQAAGEDTAVLALINPKSNNSRKHPPIGLKVTQNEAGTSIRYDPFDLSQSAELAKVLPAWAQIRNFLESQNGALCTSKTIAEGTSLPLPRVQTTLSKHKGHKWQMFGGQGQDTLWGVLGSK